MTNVLIVMSDGQIEAVYASEPDVKTFVLNYDADNRNLSTREQQCIMLGFPHDANPTNWDLDPELHRPYINLEKLEEAQ